MILLERHATPIVNVTLAVDAGYAADRAKAGLAALTLDLLDEGTATRDAFPIVDELDALGARLTTAARSICPSSGCRRCRPNLAPSLQLMADVVLNPAFPADLVALEKRRRMAQIGQEKADPRTVALRVVPRLLYGTRTPTPIRSPGPGDEATVDAITRDDLLRWHRTGSSRTGATLIVTGDVTMAAARAGSKAFGGWARGEAPEEVDHGRASAGGKVYLIDKPDAPQSVIVAAHVTERGGLPRTWRSRR